MIHDIDGISFRGELTAEDLDGLRRLVAASDAEGTLQGSDMLANTGRPELHTSCSLAVAARACYGAEIVRD